MLIENKQPVLFRNQNERELVAADGTLFSYSDGILRPYVISIFPEPRLANIAMFRTAYNDVV